MSYTYADAYRDASIGTSRAVEDSSKMIILNSAQNLIWKAFDWKWTLGSIPPFWLEPYVQDYGSPIVAVPTDFQRIQKAYYRQITEPLPITNPLHPVFELNADNTPGRPTHISLLRDQNLFRIWPVPAGGMGAPYYLIEGTYKKVPTRITTSTYQTTELPSGDDQIEMWLAAIEWAYAARVKDPEAGAVQVFPDGRKVYTKKLAMAMALISQEAQNEGLNQGGPQIAPTEGLVYPSRPGLGWPW